MRGGGREHHFGPPGEGKLGLEQHMAAQWGSRAKALHPSSGPSTPQFVLLNHETEEAPSCLSDKQAGSRWGFS